MVLNIAQTTNENVKKLISIFVKVWENGNCHIFGGNCQYLQIGEAFSESKNGVCNGALLSPDCASRNVADGNTHWQHCF